MADAGKIVITPKGAYSSTKTYEWLDEVSYNGNAYVALKTVTGVTPSDDGVNWRLFMSSTDVDANVLVPKFTEASTRSNIVSGENLSTMFGKIKKWFTDLKSHAFKDLVNNLTTSTTGSALDASQGKVLQDEVDGVNRNLVQLQNGNKYNAFSNSINKKFVTISSGNISDFANTSVTDYIDISNSISVTLGLYYTTNLNNCGVAFYNSSKEFISSSNLTTLFGTDGYKEVDITIPQNAKYIVSTFDTAYKSQTKVFLTSAGKKVDDINASLGDYGLNDKFNGWTQGGYSPEGVFSSLDDRITTEITVSNASVIRCIIDWANTGCYITLFNGSTFMCRAVGNFADTRDITASISGATKACITIMTTTSATSANKISVFVDSDIDKIKKDLGEQKKIYSESTINVGRQAGTTVGDNSTAEGADTEASGASSHSEGWLTTASNDCSHAEGNQTGASGIASHSEGTATGASGDYSHAEGDTTTASGESSHAEGFNTTASGNYSHAEGDTTTASGESSHAEGKSTKKAFDYINEKTSTSDIQTAWASNKFSIAKGESAHVEGNDCLSLGDYSHAEGFNTIANNNCSHAEGNSTKANGFNSHAEGFSTIALNNQHAQGHYNNNATATENSDSGTSKGTAFVIGNGTYSSKSNAFRITGEGVIYSTNSSVQTGADYAEYFEWSDENPDSEDRVGYFVTLDEDNPEKIRIANNGDYILGIVSGMPSVIGNGDECWKQRYILDEFGRYIVEEFEYEVVVGVDEETGEEIKETKIGTKWKENPDYDSTKPYIPRKERAEWSAIGMVGVLSVYDDGSCKVNGYCKVADGGIATEAEKGDGTYRVIKRVNENIVKIVLK